MKKIMAVSIKPRIEPTWATPWTVVYNIDSNNFKSRELKVKEEREYELEHTPDETERRKKMKEWEDEEGNKQ